MSLSFSFILTPLKPIVQNHHCNYPSNKYHHCNHPSHVEICHAVYMYLDSDAFLLCFGILDLKRHNRVKVRTVNFSLKLLNHFLKWTNGRKDEKKESFDSFLSASLCLLFACPAVVIVISAGGETVRRFLIQAHRNKLTNGDYVFFCFEPYILTEMFGNFDWRRGMSK